MHFQKLIVGMALAVSLLAVITLSGVPAARASVTLPECADFQKWIATVDPKKRWYPVEGSRAWLPAAFQDPVFIETFGTTPLKWTQAEAIAASKRLFECGSEAGDRQVRTAFYGARRWFKSNMVGVLIAHSHAVAAAKQKAEKTARREEIKEQEEARLAAEQQRRQERQNTETARGGDADLIGHVFENEKTGLAVGFLDEKRAVIGLNGKEDTAPYEVRGNQVLVYGQGMTLQLNRSGTGSDTKLEWLGKILKRNER